ncbi:MAG: family 65 glycosyl hydrolase [Lachnospiraceae bacterium]|nr:family 65 glycosyl hydrolase [Lachnospiraceae bacterium]
MGKIADRYFETDPYSVIERGFKDAHSEESESVFSLGNEYMGLRGYFEEGYGGKSLVGSYMNGIYEKRMSPEGGYKGIARATEYMVNALDYMYVKIKAAGETLDLASCGFSGFVRSLDLRSGLLKREFTWILDSGGSIKLTFSRMLSMKEVNVAVQKITAVTEGFEGEIRLTVGLDLGKVHRADGINRWSVLHKGSEKGKLFITGKTESEGFVIKGTASYTAAGFDEDEEGAESEKLVSRVLTGIAKDGKTFEFTRTVNLTSFGRYDEYNLKDDEYPKEIKATFDSVYADNKAFWQKAYETSDIVIKGDDKDQQGIRYCIFQMYQTYNGAKTGTNIGAKGLTGESYNGNAFWDTETYCLPFYIFNNPEGARNLLYFRYLTLENAKERAKELDCRGAFYPIATISGEECCNLWQHASLQLQASTAVAYGIWLYTKITKDRSFLRDYGLEMLIEISRMLASRGDFNADHTAYGYYCVMGPDEFQMMVNNNAYTNYMGRFTIDYLIEELEKVKEESPKEYENAVKKTGLTNDELKLFKEISKLMYIPRDEKTGIIEQHEGFFKLPHVDVDSIPVSDFPLYSHWSYDHIYRNDMIKQPDVLMLMLLFNGSFTQDEIKANYDYYEPKCIHESSLSPSVHSILASQLGYAKEADEFSSFATRMDLDNYNRNTGEGLHTTSIAAAWMNIVFGFGGFRCDGELPKFAPVVPAKWKGYSFRLSIRGCEVLVETDREKARISLLKGKSLDAIVYGKEVTLTPAGESFPLFEKAEENVI